jgi:hypothetical protein
MESKRGNGLDVGKDQKKESHGKMPHVDNALDKNG